MPVKNPRWPPRNLDFMLFQHQTAVISRALLFYIFVPLAFLSFTFTYRIHKLSPLRILIWPSLSPRKSRRASCGPHVCLTASLSPQRGCRMSSVRGCREGRGPTSCRRVSLSLYMHILSELSQLPIKTSFASQKSFFIYYHNLGH